MDYSGQRALKLSASSGNNIVSLYRGNINLRDTSKGFHGRIVAFTSKATITSTPILEIPQYLSRDNLFYSAGRANFGGQNLVKRGKWLVVWLRSRQGNYKDWVEAGRVLLLNQSSFAFQSDDLKQLLNPSGADYFIGDGDEIGVSIENSGSGLLGGADNVEIKCSFLETFPDNAPKIIGQNTTIQTFEVTDDSDILLENNSRRNKFIIQNTGSESAYIGYSPSVTLSTYTTEMPANFLLTESDYQGAVSAICAAGTGTSLQVTEVMG